MNYTSDIVDKFPDVKVISLPFNDYGGRTIFEGFVETLRVNADNALVRKMLSEKVDGSVLVVDGGASSKTALLGGNLANLAKNNGWAGIVVYGCVRDTHEIRLVDIGCKALGTCPRKSKKNGTGKTGTELQIADVSIQSGYYLYCDSDGIVVSSKQLA